MVSTFSHDHLLYRDNNPHLVTISYLTMTIILHLVMVTYLTVTKSSKKQIKCLHLVTVTYLTMTINLHLVKVDYLVMTKSSRKPTKCSSLFVMVFLRLSQITNQMITTMQKTVTNTFTHTYYCDAQSRFHRTTTIGFRHRFVTYGDDY